MSEEGRESLQKEVKIVDLSGTKGVWFPRWMVRRSAEILVNNVNQLTPDELRSIADVLLREAASRLK